MARFVARGKLGNRSDEYGRFLKRLDAYDRSDRGGKLRVACFGQGILRALGVKSGRGLESLLLGKAQHDDASRAV